MSKHLVDLDEAALKAARRQLGTTTIKDTVNHALRAAVVDRDDHVSALLRELAEIELDDRAERVALSHIVDTSVLKRLTHPAVMALIEPLAIGRRLARASITDLEVGYSARNGGEWDRLAATLDAFELVETSAAHVRRALQVQRLLAARSQRGRKLPDLLVAAAGEELGLVVLHYDDDFEHIAAATGQRCEWVVQRGSID